MLTAWRTPMLLMTIASAAFMHAYLALTSLPQLRIAVASFSVPLATRVVTHPAWAWGVVASLTAATGYAVFSTKAAPVRRFWLLIGIASIGAGLCAYSAWASNAPFRLSEAVTR